jgi:SAM-dependent methyltransferase
MDKTALAAVPLSPDLYDAHYYGHEPPYTANYRFYGQPHWSKPLAAWLVAQTTGPWLDVGAAFGYLTRDLAALTEDPERAWAAEWSAYAVKRAVTDRMVQADARELHQHFTPGTFGTVTSMDLLEHLEPADTERVIDEIAALLVPGGWSVNLVGWHNPTHDLAAHMSDPTHRNHEPIRWYLRAFWARGFTLDRPRTRDLNLHPVWAESDWRGRWIVMQKPEDGEGVRA